MRLRWRPPDLLISVLLGVPQPSQVLSITSLRALLWYSTPAGSGAHKHAFNNFIHWKFCARIWATCSIRARSEYIHSSKFSERRMSFIQRARPNAARPRCSWKSIRLGWCATDAGLVEKHTHWNNM